MEAADPSTALVVGGGMGTAAVGTIIWAVRMLLQRFVDQIDKGFTEIRSNIQSLSGKVAEHSSQVTILAAELGAVRQRVDSHDEKFDGLREHNREVMERLNSRIDIILSRRANGD